MNVSDTLVVLRTLAGGTLVRTGASVIVLFAANATILFLTIAYDLSIAQLLAVYCWEVAWIGLFGLAKTVTALAIGHPGRPTNGSRRNPLIPSLLSVAIVAAQVFALLFLLNLVLARTPGLIRATGAGATLQLDLAFGLSLIFLVAHAFSFLVNFLALGEFKTARLRPLMLLPTLRSSGQLIVGGLVLLAVLVEPATPQTGGFVLLVQIVKLILDYRLHLQERRVLNVL